LVGIASGVNQQCSYCELGHTNITNGEFQCFPGSPNQVTFRAKVHDRAQATAREVIMYIEQWMTSSDVVTLPVHHARLKINSTCVILLASFDDPECPGHLTPPSQDNNITSDITNNISKPVHNTTDNTYSSTEPVKEQEMTSELTETQSKNVSTTSSISETVSSIDKRPQFDVGAIVGGAVTTVFIITAGIVIMFVLYSVLKYHQTAKQLRCGKLYVSCKASIVSYS
jgi:hypothetical protein